MTKTSTTMGKGWSSSWSMSLLLQQALSLLPSPLANDSYHLAVLPPLLLFKHGKDKGAG
jgi:hypothetical protein